MAFIVQSQDGKYSEHKALFENAIKYLKQSNLAAWMLGGMEKIKTNILVMISVKDGCKNGFFVTKE